MSLKHILLLLFTVTACRGQPKKCDQTPPQADVLTPSEDQDTFQLKIGNAKYNKFIPEQTYVLTLETTKPDRNFTWYMITAEDPDIDNTLYDFSKKNVDVGSLKTLDKSMSRYSERCANTVEGFDNIKKPKIEVHWVSPKNTERVRIRAMVAENSENWYVGGNLNLILDRDKAPPKDEPPFRPRATCNLCSEARYEVIFKGRWSRLEHPRHYPNKPDENGYSHMIGASHAFNFTLWEPGSEASQGITDLATKSNVTALEAEIISKMSEYDGTRTLIRGKRRLHPNMHKWSRALFRVDPIHHLFSIAVAIRPSPDWFLGTKKFELCTSSGWLEEKELPLYPWDAGVMDGVSYDSPPSQTQPKDNIKRVEVGSFDKASPFYQTNLNELRPFAYLAVKRLDVYPLEPEECPEGNFEAEAEEEENEQETEEEPQDEPDYGPRVSETRQRIDCELGEWGDWSPCVPDVGSCGIGGQFRTRVRRRLYEDTISEDIAMLSPDSNCQARRDQNPIEIVKCYVEC